MVSQILPAGSVVLLKESTKRVMIMGFAQMQPDDRSRVYDYCGCLYPEGYQDSEKIFLFDHKDIDRVYHVGYMDEEQFRFEEELGKLMNQLEQEKAGH
ncbi:MAG: DUF4176 domain-containing protein [Blautia sp.]|nr:DUF4176 domain-containing protein [Blautia sp.]